MFGCVEWRWTNTSSQLTKTITVVLSAVCWAVLVVLWEPSAVKVFMMWQKLIRVSAKSGPDVTFGAANEDGVLQVYRPPPSCGECMLWISERLFLTLITLQYSIYHSELFFLTRPLPPPHWQAVTHIPVVTVNRTGAVFADRPWTLWRDVWLCSNARLVAAQFQTVTL